MRSAPRSGPRSERRPAPPLDEPKLDRLALRYVERFATTRGRLADYLRRKIRERGWEGEPADPDALAQRMAELGYVDDRAFAEARARSMTRRGLGARRVADALRHARVGVDDAEAVTPDLAEHAPEAALAFARRKRIGPFAAAAADRELRARQLAAMARAGHGYELARRIVDAPPGREIDPDELR
ncbi:regulatory protein RecX [uncultured Sphingomonas sp.]|uniref:regulatory protein RecX n=1 Tax=uncultured Sphingomonas sp. TaxID=158754 RepID=UPI0035C9E3C4